MADIKEKLLHLPPKPGVYQFKNARGEVLYVGKAKNLQNRVRSYFQSGRDERGLRIEIMKSEIADLDYTVVSSEIESLMLENNLIKQYQPPFNVLLRDDKNYQFIKIDYEQEIPGIYTVRKVEKRRRGEKSKYFGPYTSGLAVKGTLRFIRNIFSLCRNKKIGSKPCFAYHLGRCPGVCFGKISLLEYRQTLGQVEDLLRHRQGPLLKILKSGMAESANTKNFERAVHFRDKIRALEHLWLKQKIVSLKNENQDYLGVHRLPLAAVICLFLVREGRLIHTEYFELAHSSASFSDILERFILRYYDETSDLPNEIILQEKFADGKSVEDALLKISGRRIAITVPTRGKKFGLVKLAVENARLYHERQTPLFQKENPRQTLENLQKFLRLPKIPLRIECYDISNIQGTSPVGSMVVFTNGQADKAQYRKFKINLKETPDDFAMMHEMLTRRFAHSSFSSLNRGEIWALPDLIVIDGGKGQLNVATRVLKSYSLHLPVIGLAKRLEEIFVPGQKNPHILPPQSSMLFLLQRIRDEAHRFAITFYRFRHRRMQTRSRLEDISGVGRVTRTKLIKKFGSVTAIRRASLEAVAAKVGPALAKKIKERL